MDKKILTSSLTLEVRLEKGFDVIVTEPKGEKIN